MIKLYFILFNLLFLFIFSQQINKNKEHHVIQSQKYSSPFTYEKFVELNRPSSLEISPDLERGIYFTTSYNIAENQSQMNGFVLEFAHSDSKDKRSQTFNITNYLHNQIPKLTHPPSIAWLDHESLAFMLDDMFHAITLPKNLKDLNPKEYQLLKINGPKNLKNIENLRYHPKSSKLFFTAQLNKVKVESKYGDSGKVYDELFVRHWDTWIERDNPKQLYMMEFDLQILKNNNKDELNIFDSRPINLLYGTKLEVPAGPFGDKNDFDISKDGEWVIFTSKLPNHQQATTTSQGIYLVSTKRIGQPIRINNEFDGAASMPKFSYDGKKIAWLQMMDPIYESDRNRIIIHDIKTKKNKILNLNHWDRSPSSLLWDLESQHVIVTASEKGIVKLFRIDINTGKVRRMNKYDSVSEVQILKEDILVFKLSSMTQPPEFYTMEMENYYKLIKQSDIHTKAMKDYSLDEPESFYFKGAHDKDVHGWLIKPRNFQTWRRYPLAFLIHGGPQGAWENSWGNRWNPQIYAQRGYATVMINPTGSTGYGQNFTDAIQGDWGGAPFEDLMNGLDYILENYKFIDKSRACALGASYGGYMINWINGHTDRFRCLVNHDGMFDAITAYYTTDELYFNEREFMGTPTTNLKLYQKFSPSNYVWKWSTPTLIIHSQKDYRLTFDQGLAAFTALQRRKVMSRLLYFPDENHWVLKRANQLRWYKEIFNWIDRFGRPYALSEDKVEDEHKLIDNIEEEDIDVINIDVDIDFDLELKSNMNSNAFTHQKHLGHSKAMFVKQN